MIRRLLLLVFLLLAPFFISVSFSVAHAQSTQEDTGAISPSATVSASPSPTPARVDYTLPFPGLLPDNPLYFLKAARDRLIEFLISDPERKAEFYLLSSDKRLNSGYYLIIKGKDDMGALYISKSNNYMSMVITQAKLAAERGRGTLGTIGISIRKHQEIINDVLPKVDQKNKSILQNELTRLKDFQLLLKPKK